MTMRPAPPAAEARPVPLPVQVLTVIFYAGFAITVSVLAMVFFGMIGILVALLLAWQWGQITLNHPRPDWSLPHGPARTEARPDADVSNRESSGNTAFDAYRKDMIARLEAEQADFSVYLETLRQARDKAEFDAYVTARDTGPGARTLPPASA